MSQPTAKVAIFNKPAYPVSEAAYILNLPLATVKAWSFGQMRRDDGKVRFKAVIRGVGRRTWSVALSYLETGNAET